MKYVFLLILIFSSNLFAQTPFSNPISQIEVKANVLIWDAKGIPTDDVKQEDLKIYEDGVEQKITYFGKKKDILNLGLIVDNSGSLRHALETEITLAKGVVRNLVREDEAFLIRFITNDKIQMLQDWTSNQTVLNNKLDDLFVEGGQTAITDAVHFAAEKILERAKKDNSKRYALILITDGEDRDSYYKETQLYDLLKNSNVQIFPIAVNQALEINLRERSNDFINRLALGTGGTAFFAKYPTRQVEFDAGLTQIIRKIADELRSQYIIGYTSTNQNRDGKSRKLTVQISDNEKGEKRQAFIREGFTVPQK